MKTSRTKVTKKRVSFRLPDEQEPSDQPKTRDATRNGDDIVVITENSETVEKKLASEGKNSEIHDDSSNDEAIGTDIDDSDNHSDVDAVENDLEESRVEENLMDDEDDEDGEDSEDGGCDEEVDEEVDEDGEDLVLEDGDEIFSDGVDALDESGDENTVDNPGHEPDAQGREDEPSASPISAEPVQTFSELNLDPRLERAVEQLDWKKPTSVQGAVLPNALRGRDVLVAAPTGSGKTAAYAIPAVQHVCQALALSKNPTHHIRTVVLVPTRELVHQVTSIFKSLCRFITGIRVSNATMDKGLHRLKKHSKINKSTAVQGSNMSEGWGDIVVGTPASINSLCRDATSNPLNATSFVVVDEADLVLGYGYEKDVRSVLSMIPTSAQSLLLSATLDVDNMENFRGAVLRNPLVVKITAGATDNLDESVTRASHFMARLKNHVDRFLVTYAMLRLSVLCGKVLIFVNHINSAFRLKLFLDQFKLKSAVLNAELPANSRIHCVQQFNAGIFDTLIAVDVTARGHSKSASKQGRSSGKARKAPVGDDEFGLSRGVDFKDVAAVLNFDIPDCDNSYTHRAGRTARNGKSGTVLTLVCTDREEADIRKTAQKIGVHVGPLAFRMEQVEPFRYRVEDCLRLITDRAIRGARLADVRRELETSEQLKGYFENRPEDLDALQHSFRLAKNVTGHLGHVPSYLLPAAFRVASATGNHVNGGTKRRRVTRYRGSSVNNKKKEDPLKAFSVKGSSRTRFQNKNGIRKKRTEQTMATQSRKKHRTKRSRS